MIKQNGHLKTCYISKIHSVQIIANLYTPRTLRACRSQSKFRILKIRESSAHALFCLNSLAKVNTQLLIYNTNTRTERTGLNWVFEKPTGFQGGHFVYVCVGGGKGRDADDGCVCVWCGGELVCGCVIEVWMVVTGCGGGCAGVGVCIKGCGWVGEWVLDKWYSVYVNTHYKHKCSVLNSDLSKKWTEWVLENALQLPVGDTDSYLVFQGSSSGSWSSSTYTLKNIIINGTVTWHYVAQQSWRPSCLHLCDIH